VRAYSPPRGFPVTAARLNRGPPERRRAVYRAGCLACRALRLLAFTDYVYRQRDGVLYGERAFALFLAALAAHFEQFTIIGRLDPRPGPYHYRLPASVRFVPLPHYSSLARPIAVGSSLVRSITHFWRALDDADRVWLLGPYPHAVGFALLTLLRRKPLILGVRQDFPAYVRNRRPTRRWMHLAADALETAWRILARRCPVVVVGDQLERHYAHAPAVLNITISLITAADVGAGSRAATRSYDGELTVLSVGRIDREKNPLLMADILAELRTAAPRWRLVVCGEGPLAPALAEKLDSMGLSVAAEVHGYVPIDGGLLELYRSSHAFLHVSLTEGVPQVLFEAFASGVPIVATAVGGVAAAVGDAALLVEPNDPPAAAEALRRIADDPQLRRRLVSEGLERARRHTLEAEISRVVAFIGARGDGCAPAPNPAGASHRRQDSDASARSSPARPPKG
jgi:glycosyltransferase involved in cell wall biosynthesis